MEININEYLSAEEIKEIAKNSVQLHFNEMVEEEYSLDNLAYYISKHIVDSLLTVEQKEIIEERVTNIIKELSNFTVFREPSFEKPSKAYTILQNTVEKNQDLIDLRVKEIIENISVLDFNEDIESEIEENVYYTLVDRLFNKGSLL